MITNIIRAGAIGDAFGYQVEFDSLDAITSKYGRLEYAEKSNLPATDDTQMTLFLWEAVNKYIKDHSTFELDTFTMYAHKSYEDWYQTQTTMKVSGEGLLANPKLFKRRAPGNTCLSALSHDSPRNSGLLRVNDSKGCGSVMRVAPLLFLREHYKLSSEDVFKASVEQAAITHGNDEGLAATGFFTVLLDSLSKGMDFDESYSNSLKVTQKLRNNKFIPYILEVYTLSERMQPKQMTEKIGEGWTADSAVGLSMYCMLQARSFKDCLEIGANHSGDSDSVASMAAQLYAAENGLVPKDILIQTDLDSIIHTLSVQCSKKTSFNY